MKPVLITLLAFYVVIPAGCGEAPTPQVGEGSQAPTQLAQPAETAALADAITLPAGWVLNDALRPGEVEAIMGRTGFAPFAEAASSASTGKPIGSFHLPDVPFSKVRFEVKVDGGRGAYDLALGYLTDAVEVSGSLWDLASLGIVTSGDRRPLRIVGHRGDVFFMIDWDPEVYPELDRAGVSTRLAELLITNLFTPR